MSFNIDKVSHCENCGIKFDGMDIYQHFLNTKESPEEALKSAWYYGWSEDNKKCFRVNITGITVMGKGDRTNAYMCTKCGHTLCRDTGEDVSEDYEKVFINLKKNEKKENKLP